MTCSASTNLVLVVASVVLVAYAATASADTFTLECAASAKRNEAKLLRCASRCEDRSDRANDVPCHARCDLRYESAAAAAGCERRRPSASSVHAEALLREARGDLAEARMLRCLARCEGSLAAEACTAACQRRYLDETDRARQRGA